MERVYLSFVCASVLCVLCAGQGELSYSIDEESPIDTEIGNVGNDSNLRETVSKEQFSQIRYSFLTQGSHLEDLFRIDATKGILYTAAKIDRESIEDCAFQTKCVLFLSVAAKSPTSAYFRKLNVTVHILDINDNTPEFPEEFVSLDIYELATVGSSVSLKGAVDKDSGNYSVMRYYILNADNVDLPFTTEYETFVDGSSVVKLKITENLDRETTDAYNLVIVAEDGGEPKKTGTLSVNIIIDDANDNKPVFTHSIYNVTVNETMAVGDEILKVTATDADTGVNSEIEYRLSRNQLGLVHERFVVNETSGALTLKKKFESGGEFRVIVDASDKGKQPMMEQAVVIVKVLDSDNNRPQINVNLFSDTGIATISEYADIGTVVAHVGLIDKDTGANGVIKCNISCDEDVFKLQDYSVNEYKVVVATGLDRETLDFIYVVINCYDRGEPPLNSFAEFTVQVIDENDHAPEFLQQIYFVDVAENNGKNIDIVQVSAMDNDIGKNSELSYSIWAPVDYRFHMDPFTGFITAVSSFDFEKDQKVTLYAYAKDNGTPARTSTATVVITVTDVNDNDPQFSEPVYEFSVYENQPAGTVVNVTRAADLDSGNNGKVNFVINDTLPFVIDNKGVITTKEVLDREAEDTYFFMVTAYDQGVPVRNSTASVLVYVLDANDNEPTFIFPDAANYTVMVDIETPPNTVVTTIRAFDLDSGVNGLLFYSIENTNVSDLFIMDVNTGEISLIRRFLPTDREIYYLTVRASDNGNPKKFATTSIGIYVSRKAIISKVDDNKGENILIAIILGVVTFVLVFTIVLVIFILKRKWASGKDESDSEDRFCEKDRTSRRVQFTDLAADSHVTGQSKTKATVMETMASFGNDGNDSRDSEMTSSTVDMETPILEKSKSTDSRISPVTVPRIEATPSHIALESHHSTPRPDSQIRALKSHSALLHSSVKHHHQYPTFGHDDNHSQTSGETVTSDSGRGGSESDIHSASLSQSHDSDTKPTDMRLFRNPAHSTMVDMKKPWMNLADLRHHQCSALPVAQQLQMDQRHRLQIKSFKNLARDKNALRHSHPGLDRTKFVTFQEPPVTSSPPSDVDRTYMTFEEDDDDMSTTTSGSYTIDHGDLSLDLTAGMKTPGLRSCLV